MVPRDWRAEGKGKTGNGENGMTVQLLRVPFLGEDSVLSENTVRHPCAKTITGLYILSTSYLESGLNCKGFRLVESLRSPLATV